MKHRIILAICLCGTIMGAAAQDFGIAVQDQLRAPLINPAAMGVGNSAGITFRQDYREAELKESYDVLFSLGGLAYSYRKQPGRLDHYLAAGTEIGQGFYTGASYSWTGEGSKENPLGLSLLYRPMPIFSIGLKGEDLMDDPFLLGGIGIRPFLSGGDLISRLTLSGDARIDGDGYTSVSLGAFLEPLKGLKIYGDYNLEEEVFELGVSLSLGYLEAGITSLQGDDAPSDSGEYYIAGSFKKHRTFLESGLNKAIDYDMAQIILDSPAPGYSPGARRGNTRSLMDFMQDMERIKADPAAKAVIFRNQQFLTSFANILEIEALLKEVKARGKKIYFYYDSIRNFPYALAASVADEIYLHPAGTVDLKGFSTSRIYLKDFLTEWGVNYQNFRSHPYKTSFNTFSESGMTEEERESLAYLYEGFQGELVRMLASGRSGLMTMELEEAFRQGPFMRAPKALDAGLVDGILYEDEFDEMIKETGLNRFPYSLATEEMRYRWDSTGQPSVAVIYANGSIHTGTGIAGESIGSASLSEAIRNARTSPLIDAIVLRINSGGGSVLASDIIAREVALCGRGKNPKPVIVSMGAAAASGGYYIAAPAEKIIASPGTITGSIGVIAAFPEISGLLERFGVRSATINTEEGADTGSLLRPLNKEEQERIEAYVAETYDQFITLVSENREMSPEEVHAHAQGRVWTGSQAVERGLADETGGLSLALEYAAESVRGWNGIRIIEMVPGRRLSLLERTVPSFRQAGLIDADLFSEDLEQVLEFYKLLSRYEEGEALYLMPYSAEELGVMP